MRFGSMVTSWAIYHIPISGMVLMLVFGDRNAISRTSPRIGNWPSCLNGRKQALWSGDYFRSLENYTADH